MNSGLRRTPLYEAHVALGARMIEFGGWEMPVQYTSLIAEHRTVRSSAGIFDLSHMGEFYFRGEDAEANLQRLLTNDLRRLAPGQAQYSLICNEQGGIVDDVIVYRLADGRFLVVVNAANIDKDRAWIEARLEGDARLDDRSAHTALIAVQGPKSEEILNPLTAADLAGLAGFHALETDVGGVPALVSRTGYTGEDGFEIYAAAEDAARLWTLLLEAGKPYGMVPVGLGARDTLRLEARLPLYGNDLSEKTTPLEAGLGFAVKFDKGEFVGRSALLAQKEKGPGRRLAAFVMNERGGAPRYGYRILHGGREVGSVTSGTFSPTLEQEIGMGYVEAPLAEPGTELEVEVRGRARAAVVIKGRFVPGQAKRA